ncbi:MAG TPA: hypothetical protein VFF59_05615, partial [Anaerolineae bacterium]|nr:hypothetical protein [Anaerolineae bacterium]
MTVNPPDDAYEQAADAMAQQVVTAASPLNQAVPSVQAGSVQREAMPEEEELLQTKTDPGASIQREEMPEEDLLQTKADPGAMIQREETPEAELLQTKLDPSASIQREEMPEEEELLQTKIEPGASLQREEMPEEEELQMKAEPGPWVQRQDDGNDAPDAIIPVTVPSVSGTAELTSLDGGNPYFDQAFGKWKYKADALTTAEFLAPTFTTTGEKASPAKGCDGCDNKDCLKVSATAVITFDVNVNVDLPSGSDFTDLKECE